MITFLLISAISSLSVVSQFIGCRSTFGNTVSTKKSFKLFWGPWPEHCQAWRMISEQIWLLPKLVQHCQAFPSIDWHCCWLFTVLTVCLSVLKALISRTNALKNLPHATSIDININWIIASKCVMINLSCCNVDYMKNTSLRSWMQYVFISVYSTVYKNSPIMLHKNTKRIITPKLN